MTVTIHDTGERPSDNPPGYASAVRDLALYVLGLRAAGVDLFYRPVYVPEIIRLRLRENTRHMPSLGYAARAIIHDTNHKLTQMLDCEGAYVFGGDVGFWGVLHALGAATPNTEALEKAARSFCRINGIDEPVEFPCYIYESCN